MRLLHEYMVEISGLGIVGLAYGGVIWPIHGKFVVREIHSMRMHETHC